MKSLKIPKRLPRSRKSKDRQDKTKWPNGQTMVYTTLHRNQKKEQHESFSKPGDVLGFPGRVSSSSSTRGTRRVAMVTIPL